jgi:uncharacterized protein YkwD
LRIPACILITFLALLSWHAASARPDLLAIINAIRAQGCAGDSGVKPALRHDPLLDGVAQALASGRSVREAMTDAGYHAVQSATLEVSGADEAIARALAERGCKDIVDPSYRDVGVAHSANGAWIVLAAPQVPPTASQAQAIGRQVLALVNKARAQPRRCGWKRFNPAAPLVLSDALQRAALAHARDMAERRILSHAGRDGSTPGERATRSGYQWRVVGENIAAGQSTAEQVVAEWLESPRHCGNLMSLDYSEMGIAYAVEPQGEVRTYWAQLFAAPRPAS